MAEQSRLKNIVENKDGSANVVENANVVKNANIVKNAKPNLKIPIPASPNLLLKVQDKIKLEEKTDKTKTATPAAPNVVHRIQYHQIVDKPNTKSNVWIHFGLPADENGCVLNNTVAICKICSKPVSSKGGSTTNLMSHLKVHHT